MGRRAGQGKKGDKKKNVGLLERSESGQPISISFFHHAMGVVNVFTRRFSPYCTIFAIERKR